MNLHTPFSMHSRDCGAVRRRRLSVYVVLVIVVGIQFQSGCKRNAKPSSLSSITSNDGRYTVLPSINHDKNDRSKFLLIEFDIMTADGSIVCRKQTGASSRMRWEFAWDRDNRLWMYSGDIGTYCWEVQTSGEWMKMFFSEMAKRGVKPPPPIAKHHERVFGH